MDKQTVTILKRFYQEESLRNTVKEYIVYQLGEIAKEKAFNGEDTVGIKEARLSVDKVFKTLEREFKSER